MDSHVQECIWEWIQYKATLKSLVEKSVASDHHNFKNATDMSKQADAKSQLHKSTLDFHKKNSMHYEIQEATAGF